MTPAEFAAKWRDVELKERSAAQEHFLDLCSVIGHPTPAQADPRGQFFTFERGASKNTGGEGWADVWKQGCFAWEYKGRRHNLDAAYRQLLLYREDLENPPLLVVCDMNRVVIHTNFTATKPVVYDIPLEEFDTPTNLEILRAVFNEPERLKPGITREAVTREAASQVGEIAQALRQRGLDAHVVARFLDRVVFCLFAEDVSLLPTRLLTRIVETSQEDPASFSAMVGELFRAMSSGGFFGSERIRHFNGNLFVVEPVLTLTRGEIKAVRRACDLDWSAVDPSIFGTLFERGMDPEKRSQLGAHYTSREDIEAVVEPVVFDPLRREWRTVQESVAAKLAAAQTSRYWRRLHAEAERLLHDFLVHLGRIRILDPACGSGNFLYVTLLKLKDLEKEVIVYALDHGFSGFLPEVGPWQLHGIEMSPYAFDLAQLTVWIGYLQWIRANGFGAGQDPVLRSMDTFQCRDAIIDLSHRDTPCEPEWPAVDFIVGNPPFLGDKLMRNALDDEYVDKLRALYNGRLPGAADLCCYWFEKARRHIEEGKCRRAGLLATQGIRGGANRVVLSRIKQTGDIFFGVADSEWILDGASVHVSMVGFDDGTETTRQLNGEPVHAIYSDLTSRAVDITCAARLAESQELSYLGSCKGGPFDIDENEALGLLQGSGNPHGRPNSDVVRPVFNTEDLVQRHREWRWIIDNADRELTEACLYERPHAIVEERVKPRRDVNRDSWLRRNWWRPQRMRPLMRQRTEVLDRFLVTPTTSKHRVFAWLRPPLLPDHQLIVFARSDDYFLGVLQSRIHEAWARAKGTQLRERESGFRYTPTSCLETFPFPRPTGDHQQAITEAARELDRLRQAWLNPPEWTQEEILRFPGSINGPWRRYLRDADHRGLGTVCFARLVARDQPAAEHLATRTLTNLYNERPRWLILAHHRLDTAVFAAYGWDTVLSDEEILERLLDLNLERAEAARRAGRVPPPVSSEAEL